MKKVLFLLSGGANSASALSALKSQGHDEVIALHVAGSTGSKAGDAIKAAESAGCKVVLRQGDFPDNSSAHGAMITRDLHLVLAAAKAAEANHCDAVAFRLGRSRTPEESQWAHVVSQVALAIADAHGLKVIVLS
jgi:hypothetical protein